MSKYKLISNGDGKFQIVNQNNGLVLEEVESLAFKADEINGVMVKLKVSLFDPSIEINNLEDNLFYADFEKDTIRKMRLFPNQVLRHLAAELLRIADID